MFLFKRDSQSIGEEEAIVRIIWSLAFIVACDDAHGEWEAREKEIEEREDKDQSNAVSVKTFLLTEFRERRGCFSRHSYS